MCERERERGDKTDGQADTREHPTERERKKERVSESEREREEEKEREREKERENGQTDGHNRRTRWTDSQTDRQTDREGETDRQTEKRTVFLQVGVLMQFESFLSCHGDEMGMLEDMAVGVADLDHVTFKLVSSAPGSEDCAPEVHRSRSVQDGGKGPRGLNTWL